MIVGFPPGGGTDVVARVISQKLTEWYGQAVTVENRAGATGTIGADVVAKSAPDGYTLIMGHVNSTGIAPNLFAKLPYDPIKDFAAIAYVGYVPYKGSGDAIKDLLAGVVAMNFDTMPPVMPHIQAGKLRGLAISTPKRLPQLPDVPTFLEEGITGFDVANWYGVMAPGGTPRDIVLKLNSDINKAMQVPEVRTRLEGVGTQLREQSAAEFEAYMKAEVAKYAKLIKDTGVKIE